MSYDLAVFEPSAPPNRAEFLAWYGFFDVSANDGEVWLPRQTEYVHVFGTGDSPKALGEVRIYSITGTQSIK